MKTVELTLSEMNEILDLDFNTEAYEVVSEAVGQLEKSTDPEDHVSIILKIVK